MIWEFHTDINVARKVEIKYYALDEIMGFVGGNMGIVILVCEIFLLPYSLNKFVINKSSKKEEIQM